MDPSDERSNIVEMQNVSLAENSFHVKGQKCAIKKDGKHFTDIPLRLNDNLVEVQIDEHKQYADGSEQRNIGSPIIIDTLSENLSKLTVPEVFKQSQTTERRSNVTNDKSSRIDGTGDVDMEVSPSTTNQPSCKDVCQSFEEHRKRKPRNSRIPETGELFETPSVSSDDGDEHSVQFYPLSSNVVVIMSKAARFTFTGKLRVRVVFGSVQAYGYTMTRENGVVDMYSPRGYGNVSIETSVNVSADVVAHIWLWLATESVYDWQHSELTANIDRIQPGMAVLVLRNLENTLTKFLGTFFPFRLFPRIKAVPHETATALRRAETILQSKLYNDHFSYGRRHKRPDLLHNPIEMREITEKMLTRWYGKEWSCTLIAGGKGVGKSTMSRYLVNSLLPTCKSVVFLDIDPGQAEFTPCGSISYSVITWQATLIGPNFTHLKMPDYQLYIGHVNASRCVSRYIEGVEMLIRKLRQCPRLSHLPIVVNTMGFTQGVGWYIMISVIRMLRPSLVVQVMSSNPKTNFMKHLDCHVVNQQELRWDLPVHRETDRSIPCDHDLIVIHSPRERTNTCGNGIWNLEPYQQRELVIISYFSEILREPMNFAQRYQAATLSVSDRDPYAAPFSSLFIAIRRTRVPSTHVLNVINGNIVALGGIDEATEAETAEGLRVLDWIPLCTCYGYGIVRGVDTELEEIFISTPLSVSTMRHVNCLMGCIPVPVGLLELNDERNVPYYVGGNDTLPMSRTHRRGYFRMRYRNT